jgi:CRP-like cAMP-binding protein
MVNRDGDLKEPLTHELSADDEVTAVSAITLGFSDELTNPIDLDIDGLTVGENVRISKSSSEVDSLREMLTSMNLFSGFPDELLAQLNKATAIVHVMPETEILKQGDFNNNLYFLILGTVNVLVDGHSVALLRRRGDLLGEMSVITKKPCAATIVAKTPVELLCIDTEKFRQLAKDKGDQFDHVLYRIYSRILTDKLNVTNQKAKRLTETTAALERAQGELQDINAQLERRVGERTQAVQSKLEELLTRHLVALKDSIKAIAAASDPETRQVLHETFQEVEGVMRFIEPIVQRFNLEVSLKSKRILLAQTDKKAQTTAKMGLGGTGIGIETSENIAAATKKLASEKLDVVLVDGGTLDLVLDVAKLEQKPKVAYIATEAIAQNITHLMQLPTVPNIVSIRSDDRVGSVRTIVSAVTKLCSPNIFGFEKYLNVGAEIKEEAIKHSDDRKVLAEKMRQYFSRLGVRSSILDSVGVVLEELLMNAIYDAPTDESGQPIFNSLDRQEKVDLAPHQQGIFRYATDGALLAISVEDPFGALSASTLLKYLDSCYSNRAGQYQINKGGAGRGLHQIVENSQFVVFNVKPRRKTEVIAFFDVVPGAKEAHQPMLHYFEQS